MARILVVDDAKIMRMSIRNMLTDLGHKVIGEASSGYSAVQEYMQLKPDLVTMDITMPQENDVVDGIEAVKRIMEFDKDAKIVMITSHGEQEKVIKAIQSGATNYLLKPLKKERLKEVLDKIF